MKGSGNKFRLIGLAAMLTALAGSAHGLDLNFDFDDSVGVGDLKKIDADHWNVTGNNIVVSGNVHIPFGSYEIFADRAVVNIENKDIEAIGHIVVYNKRSATAKVSAAELGALQNRSDLAITVGQITTDLFGNQKIGIRYDQLGDSIRAQRLTGNLSSGYLSFEELEGSFSGIAFKADSGYRKADGILEVQGVTVSSCNYLIGDNAHYSVSCSRATLTPHDSIPDSGLSGLNRDKSLYTIFGYNCTVNAYGIPLLWLPVFYKPKDENPGLFRIQGGKESNLGYFLRLTKRFDLTDYPYSSIKLRGDYYTERGFGGGADVDILTENSKTFISAYGIYDNHPYRSVDYWDDRFKIPYERYKFQISNVTHITPRLDFRGSFNMQSDYYFTYDYERYSFNNNPQTSTFAALEQQFDHLSAALYVRPRVNDFYTVVERLPEFRIDVPRQEILNTNVYYQGEFSMDYLRMRWRDYGRSLPPFIRRNSLKDYETFRLDTVHFLYYPFKLLGINIIPRAGFRLTEYSNSSERKISPEELEYMYLMDKPENSFKSMITPNYDNDGGNRFRFVGEIGVEATTKFYSTWQDIRVPLLRLDGLRHVIEPYINYTFIPKPTEDRDHLFAFDEIDRIERQNFIRLGMLNRLQTRSGDSISNYLVMENYWDYHFTANNGFNHVGDFCTKLTMTPLEGLRLSTEFSIDAGGNNEPYEQPITRRGEEINHPGLNLRWLNYWNVMLTYEPVKDFVFNLSYDYQNSYASPAAYSMGSSLSSIQAGTIFDNYYLDPSQTINFGMRFPLTPDRRTFGAWRISYDFYEGGITDLAFSLTRQFHCLEVALELEFERDDDEGDHYYNTSFYGTVYLSNLAGPLQQAQSNFLSTARQHLYN